MDQTTLAQNGWGAPIPESVQSRSSEQDEDDYSSEGSYGSDESDDDDYLPLQMNSWGAQPTGSEAEEDVIRMPNWNDRPAEGPAVMTFEASDWRKLLDPNVVVAKNGLGSGNLHRKGANYKPVDEQQILNQRLKIGPPIGGGKKKRGGKKKKASSAPPPPAFPNDIALRPTGKPLTAPRRPPITNSAWGSSELQSTPFWEQGGSGASKYAPKPSTPQAPSQQQQQQRQITTPGGRPPPSKPISRWGTQPLQENPVVPPQKQQMQPSQPTTPVSKWASQPLQENPVVPAQKQPSQPVSKWASQPLQENPPAPQTQSSQQVSKWASQPLQENPPAPQTQSSSTSLFSSRGGTAASKYAIPSPASAPAPAPAPAPIATPAPSSTTVHGTISLSDPEPVKPVVKALFQLNIELHPGVSAILPVYETNDYRILVREFGAKHHLTITPEAEKSFAQKIEQMMAIIRQQQQQQQQL